MSDIVQTISNINSQLNLSDSFDIISEISSIENEKERKKILYCLLEKRNQLHVKTLNILDELLLQAGCNQYVQRVESDWSALELAFYQSDHLRNVKFHRDQFSAISKLNSHNRLILSAPTSFGKSLLIEEIVASEKYQNIVIIQPTLALLDEMRKKLRKYENRYKLIFSAQQTISEKKCFFIDARKIFRF